MMIGKPHKINELPGATAQKVVNPDGTAFIKITLANGIEADLSYPDDNNTRLSKKKKKLLCYVPDGT